MSEDKGSRIPQGKERVAKSMVVRGKAVRFESSVKSQITQREGPEVLVMAVFWPALKSGE